MVPLVSDLMELPDGSGSSVNALTRNALRRTYLALHRSLMQR